MTKDEALKLALDFICSVMVHPSQIAARDAIADALEKRLAQPEQEPVAWRNAAIRVGEDLCSVGPFGYYDMTAEQWLDWALSVVTVHAPSPHRKPLTDEEIETYRHMIDWTASWSYINFARAIEAAHGIKE